MKYPKRLIEVDLPIAPISAHARAEKDCRLGHIPRLHIYPAARPVAACRAVLCATLWPDPADELCPQSFRESAVAELKRFASRVYAKKITAEGKQLQEHGSPESLARWESLSEGKLTLDAAQLSDMPILRLCSIDFIADFAKWENSTFTAYLESCRVLSSASHESLGGVPGTLPLVVDPFGSVDRRSPLN